ncbi:MAG: hypothetical protein JSR90_00620 [Proteobacteria bacterium]|nr:hypothetical protein [Pseudomonadota bacterium]
MLRGSPHDGDGLSRDMARWARQAALRHPLDRSWSSLRRAQCPSSGLLGS